MVFLGGRVTKKFTCHAPLWVLMKNPCGLSRRDSKPQANKKVMDEVS